ncbi:LOW QUALITY PROTEIN: renin receptor-like [Liolophura sinensis]|uniref:LOW QUALITY PROTEIN: renin receptor-like n=1 Tax=Liolophura sinensis TaxID=3198878 RepID=UPI00315989BA
MDHNVCLCSERRFVIGLSLGEDGSSQQLHVLHSPKSVKFAHTDDVLKVSEIHKVISSVLGVDSGRGMTWKGLLQGSLFSRPKANVLVTIPGYHSDLGSLNLNPVAKYPISDDIPYVDSQPLLDTIQSNFLEANPMLVDLSLDKNIFDLKSQNPQLFNKLPSNLRKMAARLLDQSSILRMFNAGSLNVSKDADLSLLGELQLIKEVVTTVQDNKKATKNPSPDVYVFTISGLKALTDEYSVKSKQVQDAKVLLGQFLHKMSEDFKELYKGNVVVEVVTLTSMESSPHMRHVRSLKQTAVEQDNGVPSPNQINLADSYDPDFPVYFNIILWLMVGLAIAIFIIAYCMWNMDPGRDSIIYRMTSQRMKKDN